MLHIPNPLFGFTSIGFLMASFQKKNYDKRDDFDFDIVNFPFLDGEDPRHPSYGVYLSQLIRFARVCSHVTDFNARKSKFNIQTSTAGLLIS